MKLGTTYSRIFFASVLWFFPGGLFPQRKHEDGFSRKFTTDWENRSPGKPLNRFATSWSINLSQHTGGSCSGASMLLLEFSRKPSLSWYSSWTSGNSHSPIYRWENGLIFTAFYLLWKSSKRLGGHEDPIRSYPWRPTGNLFSEQNDKYLKNIVLCS